MTAVAGAQYLQHAPDDDRSRGGVGEQITGGGYDDGALIASNQPFNAAGTGKLHPLHVLQFLSNTDKHQLLNIVANSRVNMDGVSVDPEPPGGVVSWVNQGVVAKGSVLARVEFARPENPSTTSVTLVPVFAFEQVFRYVDLDATENWLVVGDALNEIGPDVVEAVGHVLSARAHDTSA